MKSTASGKIVEMCWLVAKQAQIEKKIRKILPIQIDFTEKKRQSLII